MADVAQGGQSAEAGADVGHATEDITGAGRRTDAHVVGEVGGGGLGVAGSVPTDGDADAIAADDGVQVAWGGGDGVGRLGRGIVSPELRHIGRAHISGQRISGQNEVEPSVPVIVSKGDRAVAHVGEALWIEGERAATVVAVEAGAGTGARVDDVQVAVIINIAPRHAAVRRTAQSSVDIGEHAATVVAIDLGDAGAPVGEASQQDVQVAVAVVIAPSRRGAIADGRQPGADVGEGAATIVAVHLGNVAAAAAAGEQQVEVAVAIVVTPGDGALLDGRQARGDVGEGAVAVVAVDSHDPSTVGPTLNGDVQVAVVVVIAPGHGAGVLSR